MEKGAFSRLAIKASEIKVKVTPKAARNTVQEEAGQLKISVTTVPEGGKATRAVTKLLARALGVAPSRLTLLRGATSRDKVFWLD